MLYVRLYGFCIPALDTTYYDNNLYISNNETILRNILWVWILLLVE
ncbi:hypothetical protein SPHINGOT1_80215 [Sphingomonas sp. T1]|nr:hypothetical protein SPHINGOT1_80215 [Sphingomonas sp. T1]